MAKDTLIKEIDMRFLKIMDIGFITVIYFLVGLFLAKMFDTYFGKFNKEEEDKKSFTRKLLETMAIMWLNSIVIYIVRNIIELIPSPFNHIHGFEHDRVKELKNAAVFTFIFLYFQSYFKAKIQDLYDNYKNDKPKDGLKNESELQG